MKKQIESYFKRLFPICRSLTGNGNRETLRILSEIIPLDITEVPSGTQCFDWIVPDEWNIKEAWIKCNGKKIVDFAENNLHILGYSEPIQEIMTFEVLKDHLYFLPDKPNAIPYLTSYYEKRWGFCLTYKQFKKLDQKAKYEVFIDSSFNPQGSMTIGEKFIKGKMTKNILFSTYICHPSLANNELSGPLTLAFLYSKMKDMNLRYSYTFLFAPETIGAIYYLSKNITTIQTRTMFEGGLVCTCVGNKDRFVYKKSRQGNTYIDRVVEYLLKSTKKDYLIENYTPASGSDERQFCSPAFNLPVGSLKRIEKTHFPEYHTSDDNKLDYEAIEQTVNKYLQFVYILENNYHYSNMKCFCEPMLSKRGLYPTLGSQIKPDDYVSKLLWILNMADTTNDLIEIAEKSGYSFWELDEVAKSLKGNDLIIRYDA